MNDSYFFYEETVPKINDLTIFIGTNISDFGVSGYLPEYGGIEAFLPILDIVKRKKRFKRIDQVFNLNENYCAEINNVEKDARDEWNISCVMKYLNPDQSKYYIKQYLFRKKITELLKLNVKKDSHNKINQFIQTLFKNIDTTEWESIFETCYNNIYVYLEQRKETVSDIFMKLFDQDEYNHFQKVTNKKLNLILYKVSIHLEVCCLKYDAITHLRSFMTDTADTLTNYSNKFKDNNFLYKISFLKSPIYRIDIQSKSNKNISNVRDEFIDAIKNLATNHKITIRKLESDNIVIQD